MSKEFNAQRLDVRAFAEEGAPLAGETPLGRFTRLIDETEGRGADAPVRWRAFGEIRNPRHVHPQVWLHLEADAVLSLTCQRCLHPVEVPLRVDRDFRFVPDESTAESEDESAEEDVLALSRAFDLLSLVEDELLMDIPLVPRHTVCPSTLPLRAVDDDFEAAEEKPNPFAVLGRLKGRQ